MNIDQENLFKDTIIRVEEKVKSGELDYLHNKHFGLRSRQVGALIIFLIEIGVIKNN